MKISLVFYALAALELLVLAFYFLGSEDSGAGVMAIIVATIFVLAAGYNRFKNGTWLTDLSGGN